MSTNIYLCRYVVHSEEIILSLVMNHDLTMQILANQLNGLVNVFDFESSDDKFVLYTLTVLAENYKDKGGKSELSQWKKREP